MQQDNRRENADSIEDAPMQLLTFSLGGEIYGIDILRVKEIRGWTPVTPIPQSPPCVLGVLNLRGEILPVRVKQCIIVQHGRGERVLRANCVLHHREGFLE